MNEVLSNPDLLRAILRAESLRAKHVARAELVCTAWARAIAQDDYWRRALAIRFPSALPAGDAVSAGAPREEDAAGAAAAHALARKTFGRRASAESRPLPSTLRLPAAGNALWELRQNYRFCLELRDGDGVTLLSASFHASWKRASSVRQVNSCRYAHDLVLHTHRGLDAPRLAALAAAGEANGGLRATLVVERRSREWAAVGAIETAPLLLDARVGVCSHAQDGYALLGVQTQCCTDEAHGGDWVNNWREECWLRRPAAAAAPADDDEDEEEEEEEEEEDFDDESKWHTLHPSLTVLLPLAPPPGRRAKVRDSQVWLGCVNMCEGVRDADEEVLMLVQTLEYA